MTDSSAGDNRTTNMWEELNRPKERTDAAPVAAAGSPAPKRDEDRDDRGGLPIAGILGGAVAIAAVAFAGFIVMGGGGDIVEPQAAVAQDQLALSDEDAQAGGEADAGADGVAEDGDAVGGDETSDPAVDEAAADDPAAEEAGDVYSPAVPAGAEGNYSVLSRGKLYLRGEVPSPLISIGAVNALEEILGEGNVISEYVINPDAPFEMGRPSDVFIEDTVLFQTGSAEIAPDFYPLLGLGVVLMEIQEGVTIEVYGHTDSAGSDDFNLTLSQARVDAVRNFWISQGADGSRVTAVGRGETEPVADNATAEGRQLNRRVEIVITGFVFSI